MLIDLDITHIFWYIRGCMCSVHCEDEIYYNLINKWYFRFTQDERDALYNTCKRRLFDDYHDDKYPREHKDLFDRFLACYDRNNRYLVTCSDGNKTETRPAYLFKGTYWVSSNGFAPKELITNIQKV